MNFRGFLTGKGGFAPREGCSAERGCRDDWQLYQKRRRRPKRAIIPFRPKSRRSAREEGRSEQVARQETRLAAFGTLIRKSGLAC